MIKDLFTDGRDATFTKADMKLNFSELMFNVLMKILAGKRYFGANADCSVEEGKRFRETIQELFVALDAANPEDFLPILKWFGFKGFQKRIEKLGMKMDQLFREMIEDRRRRERGKEARTVIDVLLSLQEIDGEQYSDELIKGTILTLIAAGTHTTSGTMEWAMSLILNHPDSQLKARDEIDKQVGQNRLVDYTDVQNLVYLNNCIKETLRLFPTVPLLLPHESSSECTVEGFSIPSNTMLFANAYAIHRDPENWAEPTAFKPERFEDGGLHASKIYFPFGLGRRSCPGEGLAMQVVGLALGALIQCFEWERIGKEMVDMTEGSGITMPKAMLLEAMYRPRQGIVDVLNNL